MFGKEEKNIIAPAVKHLRRKIKGIFGPEPADTLFYKAYHGKCDAVVCMYHELYKKSKDLEILRNLLDEKEFRWLELSEIA